MSYVACVLCQEPFVTDPKDERKCKRCQGHLCYPCAWSKMAVISENRSNVVPTDVTAIVTIDGVGTWHRYCRKCWIGTR